MSNIPPRSDTSRRSLIRPSTSPGSRKGSRRSIRSSSRQSSARQSPSPSSHYNSPTISSRLKSARSSYKHTPRPQTAYTTKEFNKTLEDKGKNKAVTANRELQLQKIANRLSDQAYTKYKNMQDLYRELDTDGDGEINFEEFDAGLKKCGFLVNRRDTEAIYQMIDRDHSRTIDYSEFCTLLAPKVCQFSSGRLHLHANIRMDDDISEFKVQEKIDLPIVPPVQQRYLVNRVQEKVAVRTKQAEVASQLLHAFKFVDPRKDGYITYDEFRTAVGLGKKSTPGMNIGLNDQEVEQLISICDIDRDGCISLREFISALTASNGSQLDMLTAGRLEYEERIEPFCQEPSLQSIQHRNNLQKKIQESFGQIPQSSGQSSEEIVNRTLNILKYKNRQRGGLKKAFNAYDQDRSGKIEPIEFQNILKSMNCSLPKKEFEQLWLKFDHDNDGHIGVDEFCDAVFRDEIVSVTSLGQKGLNKGRNKLKKLKLIKNKQQERGSTAPSSLSSSSLSSLTSLKSSNNQNSNENKNKTQQRASTSQGIRKRKNRSVSKSRSTGHLFDPLEWSKKKLDAELGSTFTKGRPETREVILTGKAPSSQYLVNLNDNRRTKVKKLYANGMRPYTAGMEHTKLLMNELEPKSKRIPFRRENTPIKGLHMTVSNYQYGPINHHRFLTTSNGGYKEGYQEPDRLKRLRNVDRFNNGQKVQMNQASLRTASSQLKTIQRQNNIRSGARAKLHYAKYVMEKELGTEGRRPGKRMWHHEYVPGFNSPHHPSPHPW